MIGISKLKSTPSHHLVMKLLLLILWYGVQQEIICSARAITDETDASLIEFLNELDNPSSLSEDNYDIDVGKRAPWAPSEIRYDAFVQKLLAGKTRLYSSRDKHSYDRDEGDENQLQRSGRSWSPQQPEVETGTLKRLDQIHKLLKQIQREVEDIVRITKKGKNQVVEQQPMPDLSAVEAAMFQANDDKFEGTRMPIGNSTTSIKLLEDILIEVHDRLQQGNRQTSKQSRYISSPWGDTNLQKLLDSQYSDLYVNPFPNYDLMSSSDSESSQIESFSGRPGSESAISSSTVNRWIQLLKQESDRRRVDKQRFESQRRSRSRRKRHYGMGLGREAIDELLSPPIKSILDNDKRIPVDSTKPNSAIRFIG